jgi:mannose-6-phosphate isomerase-like protein (cupin superfamily)
MHIPIDQARARLKDTPKTFVELFTHGSLSIELYKPDKVDLQLPHTRDEVYIIVSGTGRFKNGEDVISFAPHDFLFVPAGIEHRFIDFTEDFSTWVIFYGPEGGEKEKED